MEDEMTPAEKAARTRAKNKRKSDPKVMAAAAINQLSAAGFSAAQIAALQSLFKAS